MDEITRSVLDPRCAFCGKAAEAYAYRTFTHPDGLTEYAHHPEVPRGKGPGVCLACGNRLQNVFLEKFGTVGEPRE